MGVRNRQRRTAKSKSRKQQHRQHCSAHGQAPGHSAARGHDTTRLSLAETIDLMLYSAVEACAAGDRDMCNSYVDALVDPAGALAGPGQAALSRELVDALSRHAEQTWRAGWQPADLARAANRELGATHAPLLVDAIAARMRQYPSATVDRRWADQVSGLGASVWWGSDDQYLGARHLRDGVDRTTLVTRIVESLVLLTSMPDLPMLGPLPGAARNTPSPRRDGPPVESRMLDKVRALLAKAESTEFPEEAEALTAKAQELMARHSIDAALLAAAGITRDDVLGWRIGIDAPYEQSKVLLLQNVAEANRCRVVWSRRLGFATVFGYEADLQAVELLHTSLLVQATAAVVRHGSRRTVYGQSRTRSFRQSFLNAFAIRIGERLRGVTEEATRAASAAGGAGGGDAGGGGVDGAEPATSAAASKLLPVLAAREETVRERVEQHFPGLQFRSVSITDREGWASGTAAADQAIIHKGAGHLSQG